MPESQAGRLLKAAGALGSSSYRHVVAFGKSHKAGTHAAAESGALACGTKPGRDATVAHFGDGLILVTCRTCRAQIGLDGAPEHMRIEALCVLALTLGMRPGELRALRERRPLGRVAADIT